MKRSAFAGCLLILAGCAADRAVDRVLSTPDGKNVHCIAQPDGYLVKCGDVMIDTSPRRPQHSEETPEGGTP